VTEDLDLFDELAASDDAPMEGGGGFEDLPQNAWVLARTATMANGGWAPQTRGFDKKEGGKFYRFKCGLLTVGGDKHIKPEHKSRIAPFDAPVEPWEDDKGPVSGRLAGFMNCVLAKGVAADVKDKSARSKARWAHSMGVLKEYAGTNPTIADSDGDRQAVTLAAYGGDKGRYLTGLLVSILSDSSEEILCKTKLDKNKKTGEEYGVKASTIEEATDANIANRKIERLEAGEDDWS